MNFSQHLWAGRVLPLCLIPLFVAMIQEGSFAQTAFPPPAGAAASGMGYTGLNIGGAGGAFINPASLAKTDQAAFLLFGERRFGLNELDHFALAGSIRLHPNSVLGLSITQFGDKGYLENRLGAAFALEVEKGLSLGLQLMGWRRAIPEAAPLFLVLAEAGLWFKASEHLEFGCSIYNPGRAGRELELQLPAFIRLGLQWKPTLNVQANLELEKGLHYPLSPAFGLEYRPSAQLAIRTGARLSPVEWTSGLGLPLGQRLRFDFAAAWHPFLGWSPSLSISTNWDR